MSNSPPLSPPIRVCNDCTRPFEWSQASCPHCTVDTVDHPSHYTSHPTTPATPAASSVSKSPNVKTLSEITTAVRSGQFQELDPVDMAYAIAAYDVFIAQLELHNDPKHLQKYFIVAESPPVHYVSPHNDPLSADACGWYKTMMGVADRVDADIEG